MKNKKLTYLLIVGAIVVWGLIFYRILAAMQEEKPLVTNATVLKPNYFKQVNHEDDTFTLKLDYRDPFSAGSTLDPIVLATEKVVHTGAAALPKPPLNWPNVSYTGYIHNAGNQQKVTMLVCNGKELLLTDGQSSNGIKLIKNAGDSIKVQYQNETKFFRIK